MNNINYFSKLSFGDLSSILRYVYGGGSSHFLALSGVCRCFNNAMNEGARKLYTKIESQYGRDYLRRALQMLGLDRQSYVAKIQAIFAHALFYTTDIDDVNNQVFIRYSEASSLGALDAYMLFWQESEVLFKLCDVLEETGHPALKKQLSKVQIGRNYFKNIMVLEEFFKANRSELSKVTTLDLSNSGLKALPKQLWECFPGLRKLDLSGNCLTSLPSQIGSLSKLESLRLNDNELKSLPKEIGNLRALINFECAYNALESLPDSICKMRALMSLNLSCNRLESLPNDLHGLKNLKFFYLEYNVLKMLSPSIGYLPKLVGLYLIGNDLTSLPNSMRELENLQYLVIQDNQLVELPKNIGDMQSLRSLCVDGNKLTELPESIVLLEDLEYLSFSDNQISDFPKGMNHLKKLKHFCFEGNPIGRFSKEMEALPFWSLNAQYYPHLENGHLKTTLNTALTKSEFNDVYQGLGNKKWMEFIDGVDHLCGENVYDDGSHGGVKEPGFARSMWEAFDFLDSLYNQRVNKDFYLDLHQVACSHFNGKKTNTLMGQKDIRRFRNSSEDVGASVGRPYDPISKTALNEFKQLNADISKRFGATFMLGNLLINPKSPNEGEIEYAALSESQVSILFNFFLTEFYYEIGHATLDNARVRAIAKLIQRLEWLHPFPDGCGRTDTALLNFLLCCYGFNPVLLDFPYVSSCMSLDEWTATVLEGMKAWRIEVAKL